ncbi:hypothetical protein L249_6998 [Ophiocordyceps polyrhachis-furcata BCC 54312]|uniref:VPS4-associated protein 1 n=1 Tax=Ophiocordyceps polyrhachis-furcata BCC 54312 TaxID=1330021 RepID=A0A367LKD7_9HYPO|nr:hypothetical protein L249_6998 [Ophiocordyceps polyrhachis-furcata BCC 54312]
MSAAPFLNLYSHRKVAESSAKACDICYKPSTSVLITADSKDFFYVCPAHLKDRYFCTPKIDEDAVKAKREKALAEEMERLKDEYEERQRKKKDKDNKDKDNKDKDKKEKDNKDKDKKEKDKDKDNKDKDKDKEKDDDDDEDKDEKKAKQNNGQDMATTDTQDEEPRIFELKSAFFQQRLQKKRQAEAAKRDRERASQPNYFPSVPTDLPGK